MLRISFTKTKKQSESGDLHNVRTELVIKNRRIVKINLGERIALLKRKVSPSSFRQPASHPCFCWGDFWPNYLPLIWGALKDVSGVRAALGSKNKFQKGQKRRNWQLCIISPTLTKGRALEGPFAAIRLGGKRHLIRSRLLRGARPQGRRLIQLQQSKSKRKLACKK